MKKPDFTGKNRVLKNMFLRKEPLFPPEVW